MSNIIVPGVYDFALRYAAGQIGRAELISLLSAIDYAPEPQYGFDGLPTIMNPSTTWSNTMGRVLDEGLIDDSIYDEVLNRVARQSQSQ